jgi:hypothetical protein
MLLVESQPAGEVDERGLFMTAVAAPVASGQRQGSRGPVRRRLPSYLYPIAAGAIGAIAFLVVHPQVGDLWAARARQSAAAHGVGLTYWFSWFGGGSTPGNYSVLIPFVSTLLGAAFLGALATAAITPLCWRLVRGSSYPLAATWVATVAAGLSLWSGRIPFAVGTAISVAALIAVRDQRRILAALLTVLTVLFSPVSGAFIALGLVGTLLYRSYRTISATTILTAGVTLGVVGAVFGAPGPEGFTAKQALVTASALLLFLASRPPKHLGVVILLSLLACPLLVAIPNGMGSNFQRLVWICLPVAVVATARTRLRFAGFASALAIVSGALGTAHDVAVARAPMSTVSYYAPLAAELDRIPALTSYRLEAVPDGTHTASYALLDHAMLARGYLTQTDNALNAVLTSRATLNALTYKIWLDNNAVGYVAIGRTALNPNPEYELVSGGQLPYLTKIWSDTNWTLYRVESPTPIVAPPARIRDADQSSMTVDVPKAGKLPVRVRWSKFLTADAPGHASGATVTDDGYGWTILTAPVPGPYVLHG